MLLNFRFRHDFNNSKILPVIPSNVVSVHETCYASHHCWMQMQKININLLKRKKEVYLVKYGEYHCCWMLDDAMSRIMSRADRDLGLKYPLPISSSHRSGDTVHIQTKLRFRYSAFYTQI